MANPEHVEVVKQGPEAIAGFENEHRDVEFDCVGANFSGVHLCDADLSKADLSGADLSKADLSYADCSFAKLVGANLSGARLVKTYFGWAELGHANFARAYLREANLSKADLSGADLSEAKLYDASLSFAKLGGAILRGTDLGSAELQFADLSGADLTGAILSSTDFTGAKLIKAELCHANLLGADLSRADLSEANLSEAELIGVNFSETKINGTDFKTAICSHAVFLNIDLCSAHRLETVSHYGPSSVDVDTLYGLKGKIPRQFLSGCGVPDKLIEYLFSLVESPDPTRYYSCFISYSNQDEEFCKRLHSRMRDEHLRTWLAPEVIEGHEKWHAKFGKVLLTKHDKLLIVLSDASINSEWVATEIYNARQREKKEGKRVLFPIRLVPFEKIKDWKTFDADTGKDMGREIREYFIPDFSDWKDRDSFAVAFERLLNDLNGADESGE